MSWRHTILATASAIGLVLTGTPGPATAGPDTGGGELVHTDRGPVRGIAGEDFLAFQGIPFAAPPVGELRFRPPQPAPRWREPLDATALRNACAQPPLFGLPGRARGLPLPQRDHAAPRARPPAGHGVDPRRQLHQRRRLAV